MMTNTISGINYIFQSDDILSRTLDIIWIPTYQLIQRSLLPSDTYHNTQAINLEIEDEINEAHLDSEGRIISTRVIASKMEAVNTLLDKDTIINWLQSQNKLLKKDIKILESTLDGYKDTNLYQNHTGSNSSGYVIITNQPKK